VANPGCFASGFIALVAPLIRAGLLDPGERLCCHGVSGYSGGGKKMIAQYEDVSRGRLLDAPRAYGLGQAHKHLPEMTAISGLRTPPVFCPVVAPFYSGLLFTVPLHASQLRGGPGDLREVYKNAYHGPVVRYAEPCGEAQYLSAAGMAGSDGMEIAVFGNGERLTAVARFDNLGKGASGAAVQCLNILIGVEETTGLNLAFPAMN
jgi:N-acetyl-gamma-glutamyl-phosphate reductase